MHILIGDIGICLSKRSICGLNIWRRHLWQTPLSDGDVRRCRRIRTDGGSCNERDSSPKVECRAGLSTLGPNRLEPGADLCPLQWLPSLERTDHRFHAYGESGVTSRTLTLNSLS